MATSGRFELAKSSDGQFRFSLKSASGASLLSSEGYTEKASALNGIRSVQTNAPLAERYAGSESKNGKFYFTLKAANHQVIGTSRMYATTEERDAAIETTRTCGATTTIDDQT